MTAPDSSPDPTTPAPLQRGSASASSHLPISSKKAHSGGRVGLMDEFCAQIGEPGDCEPLDAGDVLRPSTRRAAAPGRMPPVTGSNENALPTPSSLANIRP
jgi:hypothetical protein